MAYKVFTNGSPLPASDLNTYLMNQSVMTFANSTARSTALPTPTEGMVTWLDDSNRLDVWNGSSWVLVNDNAASVPLSTVTTAGDLIVANGNASVTRLGIGTNGQILSSNGTTATWTTPAGGGGFTLLSTTTLSGSSTIVSSISQSYKNLRVVVTGLNMSGNASVILEFRNGTTAQNIWYIRSNDNVNTTSQRNETQITLPGTVIGATNCDFVVDLCDYTSSNFKSFTAYGSHDTNTAGVDNLGWFASGSVRGTGSNINAVAVFASGQTFAGGNIRIFGEN